jgi:tetratricopeptide (TPR) repeat protein
MQSGKTQPFISRETVRAALDSLLYLSKPLNTPNPLESLVLVDEFLVNPDVPDVHHARGFAIQHILANIIVSTFSSLRNSVNLPPLISTSPLESAFTDLKKLMSYNNPELMGWGILYYRYIRTDLNIGVELLASTLNVDERTYRRYFAHGVRRLTEQLIEAEWNARTHQRQRRLLGQLPSRLSSPIFGRESEYHRVRTILDGDRPHHFQITGAVGVGKSTFVQELLRERIDTEQIDQLLWLHTPPSVDYAVQCLIETLLRGEITIKLREFLQLYRVAVVLDGTDSLVDDASTLEAVLNELISVEVYLVGRHFLPLPNLSAHIHLSELTYAEAAQLAQFIASQDTPHDKLSDESLQRLWRDVGGNPQAIRLAVRDSTFGVDTSTETVERIYDTIYEQLEDNLRSAWFMCSILPPNHTEVLSESHALKNQLLPETELYNLGRRHLVEISSTEPRRFFLTSSARYFLQTKYHRSITVRHLVDNILRKFEQLIAEVPLEMLEVCEHILRVGWPPLDGEQSNAWVINLAPLGLQQGRYVQWHTILERQLAVLDKYNPDLGIAYGVCLRRLSEWGKAQSVFQQAISYCGQQGLFLIQASAMLEMAVLCRYQSHYQQAIRLLNKVEEIATRYKEEALKQSLLIEYAQIAVERGDLIDANRCFTEITHEDTRILMLRSDVSLLAGDYEECRRWAARILSYSGDDKPMAARVHTIIGRSYEVENQWLEAHRHFETALNLFEQDAHSLFGLGRAKLNLGSILIQEKLYDEAYSQLKLAESSFVILGDKAALAATRHNLRLLKILSVS